MTKEKPHMKPSSQKRIATDKPPWNSLGTDVQLKGRCYQP